MKGRDNRTNHSNSVNYFSGLRGLFLLAHCVTQIVIRAS